MNKLRILSAVLMLAASVMLFSSIGKAQMPAPATVPSNVDAFPIKAPLKWVSSGPLVKPIQDAGHPIVSVKDPTIIYYNDAWHIYATTANTKGA